MHQKLIRQYYVLSFLFTAGGIQIISAVYVTFLMKNGLNLFEVNLVNAAYFFTLFICEIPTGAFADIFGRKRAFVSACGLMSLAFIVYGFSHTFFGFLCAEIISAVGATFKSGAFQAWLVDSLKHRGYTDSYNKIFSRENIFNRIGAGGGAILGAYLSVRNPALPWFIGGGIMFFVMIFAYLTMQEEYFVHVIFSWKKGLYSMKQVAVTSIHYGSTHKAVKFILITTFIQIYAVKALDMYWQPFFKNLHVEEKHLGFLFTAIALCLAAGAFLASWMKTEGKERQFILWTMLYVGVLVIIATTSSWLPLTILFFVFHEIGRGFWEPMKNSYLHERIPSNERATISSFCSIAPHIGGAIGLLISGLIAQGFGISVSWIVSGGVLILGAFLLRKNGYPTT